MFTCRTVIIWQCVLVQLGLCQSQSARSRKFSKLQNCFNTADRAAWRAAHRGRASPLVWRCAAGALLPPRVSKCVTWITSVLLSPLSPVSRPRPCVGPVMCLAADLRIFSRLIVFSLSLPSRPAEPLSSEARKAADHPPHLSFSARSARLHLHGVGSKIIAYSTSNMLNVIYLQSQNSELGKMSRCSICKARWDAAIVVVSTVCQYWLTAARRNDFLTWRYATSVRR